MKRPKLAGDPGMGWAPIWFSRATRSGCARASLTALFMPSMAARGVPARAMTPNQALASWPA
jgi:hypothetical protein